MTSILKVDTIQDTAGNNIINESSDTITIGASGDTVNIVGTLQNNGSGVGITMADQWRLTSDLTTTDSVLTTNLERVDTAGQGTLGTGMTESSGIFSFPSTGIYLVQFNAQFFVNGDSRFVNAFVEGTIDNSSYSTIATGAGFIQVTDSGFTSNNANASSLVDVTDVSNVKVRFKVTSFASVTFGSNTAYNRTYMTFIRLGDT